MMLPVFLQLSLLVSFVVLLYKQILIVYEVNVMACHTSTGTKAMTDSTTMSLLPGDGSSLTKDSLLLQLVS